MIAYQTDREGVYVGVVKLDRSPLEPDIYLYPAGAVPVEPPNFTDGQFARWDGSSWHVEDVAPEPEPEPEPPATWDTVRLRRDSLLVESDWTQLADAPLTAVEQGSWAVYRQALRDVPQTQTDPDDIVWPAR